MATDQSHSWIDLIIAYLKNGEVLEDKSYVRTLRAKSTRYTLVNERLYKRDFNTPLLRCVNRDKADYILQEIHEGICEYHSR